MSAALPQQRPAVSQAASTSPYVGDTRIEYFEPPSRFQLLDKLHHLIRFSDFLILVQGEGGSGKTSLLRQFRLQADGGRLCRLALQDKTSSTALLRLLCDGCDLENDGSASDAQRLELFSQEARLAEDAGLQWLVLVDNADQLMDDALRLLVNLQRAGMGSIRPVLAGSRIGQRLIALGLAEELDARIHQEHLIPFSEAEAADFIRLRYPALEVLDSRKLQQLVRCSDRLPGTLERLASASLRLKAPVLPLRRDMSGVILSGVTLMLLVIVGIAGWIYWIPEQSSVSPERVSVPLPVPVVAASINEVPATIDVVEVEPDLQSQSRLIPAMALVAPVLPKEERTEVVAPVTVEAPSEPASPLVEVSNLLPDEFSEAHVGMADKAVPEPVLAKTQDMPAVPAVAPAVANVAKVEAGPASKPKIVQVNVAPPAVIAAAKVPLANEEVLLNWPDRGYTLQLLGARQLSTAKDFIAGQTNPDGFDYFSTLYKGKPWHVVIFGRYNSRQDAGNAVREMPQSLQKLQPWARSIQSVKSDIRRIYP